jgi:hypothetical protein
MTWECGLPFSDRVARVRWISPVLLFLSIGTLSMSSAEPESTATGKLLLLPDLVIDTTAFGPAFCST